MINSNKKQREKNWSKSTNHIYINKQENVFKVHKHINMKTHKSVNTYFSFFLMIFFALTSQDNKKQPKESTGIVMMMMMMRVKQNNNFYIFYY
jgi:hypothetical protein